MFSSKVASEKNAKVTKNGTFFQPKLAVNDPSDRYEQEADATAERIMRMAEPAPQSGIDFISPALNPEPQTIFRSRDGESTQEGLNEETVTCPPSERLDEIEQSYRSMIESARAEGADVAADNLDYFLSGAGGTRTLGVEWLRGFSEVTDAERKNQERFENSLADIADTIHHGDTRSFDDYWDAQLTGGVTTELYYASGTSTIRSTGNFTLDRIEDIVNISGSVAHRWYDPYDWHAGLGAYIPGHGNVSDTDGLVMQSCRGAQPFQMEATWNQRVSGTVRIRDYWFNSTSFSWTGP